MMVPFSVLVLWDCSGLRGDEAVSDAGQTRKRVPPSVAQRTQAGPLAAS